MNVFFCDVECKMSTKSMAILGRKINNKLEIFGKLFFDRNKMLMMKENFIRLCNNKNCNYNFLI